MRVCLLLVSEISNCRPSFKSVVGSDFSLFLGELIKPSERRILHPQEFKNVSGDARRSMCVHVSMGEDCVSQLLSPPWS